MRKINEKSNLVGSYLSKIREEKRISKEDVCKKLQLSGINIDRVHLYRMEQGKVIIKDFELIKLCQILDTDMNELKKFMD